MGKRNRSKRHSQDANHAKHGKTVAVNKDTSEESTESLTTSEENLTLEESGSGFKKSEYFEDDESMLRGDDKKLHESNDIAIFEQLDNVISWEIENYYGSNGKPRNRFSLRNDPPILKISGSNGDSTSFVLSREFSGSLSALLKDIERSYYGVGEMRDINKPTENSLTRVQGLLAFLKQHAVVLILICLILGMSIIPAILG